MELTLNGEQEFGRGVLPASIVPWTPGASPLADGQRLFGLLLADQALGSAWSQVKGQAPQRRIRLRIDAAAPELHAIPWELLQEPAGDDASLALAAATATPFSRYLAGHWQPGSPILQRPVQVLVAIADPHDLERYQLAPVNADQEWESFRKVAESPNVALTRLAAPCTLGRLEQELRQGYHVLHIIAHGVYDATGQQGMLVMPDDENRASLVADADLAGMLGRQLADAGILRDDQLRLVFLDSCQSATRSPADAFRGVAPKLVAAGVPAVLAMQDLVPVATARQFTRTFYERLLQHGLVDLASNEARSSVQTAQLPGASIPVLFMRLRSGQLLGQRGVISSQKEDLFWPFLLENIERGYCTALLGPRVSAGLLPSAEAVAEQLADKYGYPMADRQNLARVAQFVAISDPGLLRNDYLRILQRSLFPALGIKPDPAMKERFRAAGLSQTIEGLDWSHQVLAQQESEIHHLLAELPLPLYVTTNPDSFMFEALKLQPDRIPRRLGPRWTQAEAGTPQFVLAPTPSAAEPVVFHLNGFDGDEEQAQHLVLSEDDYLSQFVRLSRDQETILPMNVLRMLSEHSLLFLGYQLEDWELRTVLQGLIKPIAQTNRTQKLHVGVQLDVDQATSVERARAYLERYLDQFNIDIYWGTAQQFVSDLHSRWQAYREAGDDAW